MAKKGSSLALDKDKKVKRPDREPDMVSKRGVPYWFEPEWVRDTNGTIGRIVLQLNTIRVLACIQYLKKATKHLSLEVSKRNFRLGIQTEKSTSFY